MYIMSFFKYITISIDNSCEQKCKLKQTMEKCLISEEIEIKMRCLKLALLILIKTGAIKISKNKRVDK